MTEARRLTGELHCMYLHFQIFHLIKGCKNSVWYNLIFEYHGEDIVWATELSYISSCCFYACYVLNVA